MANLYVIYNGLTMGPIDEGTDPTIYKCGGSCAIPTPFVSRSDRYEGGIDGKAHKIVDISIVGKIYDEGNPPSYAVIDARRNAILNAFDEDFHTLTAGNYTFEYVKVNEVSFDSENVGIVGFNISLTCYDQWFADANIAEPKNEYSYSEGEDGVLTFRHSVSARVSRANSNWEKNAALSDHGDDDGDIDENDPVAEARRWCLSQTCAGLVGTQCENSFPLSDQSAWTNFSIYHPTLNVTGHAPFSISHNYNRINGTYSIEEVWKQGKYSTGGYVEHYDISEKYNAGNDEFSTIQINYSIKGPPGTTDATLRSMVPNSHTGANSFYSKLTDGFGTAGADHGIVYDEVIDPNRTVDPEPISYEVKENMNEASINVSIAFNQINFNIGGECFTNTNTFNDWTYTAKNCYYHAATLGYAYLDWDVSISEDAMTEVTTVDVSAVMKSKGSLSVRKARTSAWFSSIDPVQFAAVLAAREYYAVSGGTRVFPQSNNYQLQPYHDTYTAERNEKTGEIKFNASFSDKDHYYATEANINAAAPGPAWTIDGNNFEWQDFTFDINQKCAMNVLSMKAGQNGTSLFPDYLIFDHNTLSKETTTISARGQTEDYINGRVNYMNGGLSIPEVTMGLFFDDAQANFIQPPLNGVADYRALDSHDITKGRKGIYTAGLEVGNFISKSLTVSQTVGSPFVSQDGIAAPLGTGIRP